MKITTVSKTYTLKPQDIGNYKATCPAGSKLTGGGYDTSAGGWIEVRAAYPASDREWNEYAYNTSDKWDIDLTVYAICLSTS